MRQLRREENRPQMPHSDYVGFTTNLAAEINVLPNSNLRRKVKTKILVPALFALSKRNEDPFESVPPTGSTTTGSSDNSDSSSSSSIDHTKIKNNSNTYNSKSVNHAAINKENPSENQSSLDELEATILKYKQGYQIAYDIFQSLTGDWSMQRQLMSKLDSSPSGSVTGRVKFIPIPHPSSAVTTASTATVSETGSSRRSSNSNSNGGNSNGGNNNTSEIRTENYIGKGTLAPLPPLVSLSNHDLLYEETGHFTTEQGMTFEVSRQYIYTYNPDKDTLDVYFAKLSPDKSSYARDYIFVSLHMKQSETGDSGWMGECCHPCGQDIYESSFLFTFQGIFLKEILMKYTVTGPFKDYLSVTTLHRINSSL
jgi:hypothetical protein